MGDSVPDSNTNRAVEPKAKCETLFTPRIKFSVTKWIP